MRETFSIIHARSAELSENEIEQLRFGKWRLDCPQIQFRSRGKSPVYLFSGPGYIFQPFQGAFAFRLYSHRKQRSHKSGFFDQFSAGEIIPDGAFFDLSAEDTHGRRWHSRRILPDSVDRATSGKMVIDGKLDELSMHSLLPHSPNLRGNYVRLHAFQQLNVPLLDKTIYRKGTARWGLRNAWQFRCLGTDFRILQEEPGQLQIEAHTKSRPPACFEDRIIGALEFVAGHAVQCEVLYIRRVRTVETKLRKRFLAASGARLQPPLSQQIITIPGTNRRTSRHHKRLFQSFLAHGLLSRNGVSVPVRKGAIFAGIDGSQF